ncbi:MAG: pyridoxal phosphate-dependent aminotransferase [Bacteroidales bacterium]|nr:pyridoxal phosphate-dependent aminotransferase [Bacteroidales bacterium]MDD2825012.1 pyridoxal phosphate-dependent aminotransferase [Bacteroidales bacterium]MDD3101083.1 pyridoxal phosphate-dependent aminotransferase [Bacteroidales bacterium]MDD3639661.1 pyridoxal phosphate-dependent aminotransferase [Bacteroidales bacterium]MDD3944243.1 pyridoxal phosphate-dependent aminotransferase [Bacteroidales bacterium]
MLGISELSRKMPASPIRKLVPYAEAAKKRGVKVYHLNIGQPDIASPREAIDAVRNTDLKLVSYPHSAGIETYRRGLAKYYQGVSIDLSYEEIIITVGGSEALQIALKVCCNPGDEVIVFEPFYTNYNTFALMAGVKFVPVTTTIESGFALPPMSEVEKYITPRTKAILINSPGNPTGTLYTKEDILQLGDIVKKHQLFLLSDEVYREFCYSDDPHFSCMHIPGAGQHVILIDSVSKRYSLCGVRIGCIASHNKEVMSAVLRFAQARLCAPALGQIAAEGALATPQEYFDAVKQEYIDRRDLMIERLNKMEGVYSPMPMGAFYTTARLPVDDSDKFAQWLLESFSYKGQTVMVAPAAGFYATPGKGTDEVRIAYVLKKEDINHAMDCLEEALKQYPGRR